MIGGDALGGSTLGTHSVVHACVCSAVLLLLAPNRDKAFHPKERRDARSFTLLQPLLLVTSTTSSS
jgi:hypothetical protein